MAGDGEGACVPKTLIHCKTTSLRLPGDLFEEVAFHAKNRGLTWGAYCRYAVERLCEADRKLSWEAVEELKRGHRSRARLVRDTTEIKKRETIAQSKLVEYGRRVKTMAGVRERAVNKLKEVLNEAVQTGQTQAIGQEIEAIRERFAGGDYQAQPPATGAVDCTTSLDGAAGGLENSGPLQPAAPVILVDSGGADTVEQGPS